MTANKGPVAFALRPLKALAARKKRLFLHEGAVMDGTPVFNLVERCLRGARIVSFRGTLNSTTNLVLSRMEEGLTASAAVKEAQRLGIAETDPRNDLEGWDAAVKGCALANALMGGSVRPTQVRRRGIAGLTALDARRAVRAGTRLRLVVRGIRQGGRVRVSVAPERVPFGDPALGLGPRRRPRARDRPHGRDRRLRARRDRGPDGVCSPLGPAPGDPGGLTRNAALSP